MKALVITGALALTVATACSKPEAQHPAPEGTPARVTVATAHEEPLAVVHRASGTVRGRNTAVLTSKTTGYVRAVRVRPGDMVRAGQPLVDLEANDVKATVARAHAALGTTAEAKAEAENALEAARAAAKVAKSSYDRAASLLADKAIPQAQFDEAEARWNSARAQEQMAQARVRGVGSSMDEAKAAVGEANAMLGYAEITAPFAGRVLERRVDPGALAGPGTPLLVVADEGALRVEAPVEESRAGDVHVGDVADVEVEGKGPIKGVVGEVVPSVDVASRAFLVKVDLPAEAGALRPGTFARVGFHVGERPRLVVPVAAVTPFGALERVFVVDGARARLRMITRGEAMNGWAEVLSGLSPGERVVAAPGAELRDGAPVEVVQ